MTNSTIKVPARSFSPNQKRIISANEFPYRLFGTDMDATLLGPDGTVSAINRVAVRAVRNACGVYFVLASGRIGQLMEPTHAELGLDEPIIACNGAHVYFPGGETISATVVPADVASWIWGYASKKRYTAISYFTDGVYVTTRHHWTDDAESHEKSGQVAVTFRRQALLRGRAPLKIMLIDEPARLNRAFAELVARYGDSLQIMRVFDEQVEIMGQGIDKVAGLEALCKYYGIDRGQVATFGDGNNDVGMLRWAGMSAAMHHGVPAAKRAAKFVALSSCRESNFAAAVMEVLARGNRNKY